MEDPAKNAAIIQQLSQILKGIKNKKEEEEKIPLTNLNKQKTHKDLRFWINSEGNLMISTSGEQRDFNPSILLINEVFSFNCLVGQTPCKVLNNSGAGIDAVGQEESKHLSVLAH